MRAVDTNVLVRLLTGDDTRQLAKAETFVAVGAWVSTVVLCETVWVLESVYERSRHELLRALEMLLSHATLVLDERTCVEDALREAAANPKTDFSDALIVALARKSGRTPLGTFDRHLAKLEGTQRL
ncbi:MAG: type II toxin-antitoxin system VapC family toxin [Clostridia bacterium]|nr:type II toxin-antitoxin system VapC family toxin [Deltaproteobacteria bacterium]